MCGIAGWISAEGRVDVATLARMRDSMRHRGPDDSGLWCSDDHRVGLAHRRLSIIDLSTAGRQPMWNDAGTLGIIFNGEIYNYQVLADRLRSLGAVFRTSTDTEVILKAYAQWGASFVDHLDGMFAIAIFDAEKDKLILARDRVGKKPLYYAALGREFLFASELRSLRSHPGVRSDLSPEALNHYLARGHSLAHQSLLADARKLPPATVASLDLKTLRLTIRRYWDLPLPAPASTDADGLTHRMSEILTGAVRRRMVADVPVGLLLSGGLDSGLVAAAAARIGGSPIRTFTIAMGSGSSGDESAAAASTASSLGLSHEVLEATDGLPSLSSILEAMDEPIGDSSFIPSLIVSKLARSRVTVALTGDGGDELFAGYPHYLEHLKLVSLYGRLPTALRQAVGAAAAFLPAGAKGRSFLTSATGRAEQAPLRRTPFFEPYLRRRFCTDELLRALGDGFDAPERAIDAQWPDGLSLIDRMTRFDFTNNLPEGILVKMDRASMHHALEARSPWLDTAMVDFAYREVPVDLKIRAGETRILQRRLAALWLPQGTSTLRKQGFSVPIEDWFRGRWKSELERPMTNLRPWIREDEVRDLATGILAGRTNGARWFALAALDNWLGSNSKLERELAYCDS